MYRELSDQMNVDMGGNRARSDRPLQVGILSYRSTPNIGGQGVLC